MASKGVSLLKFVGTVSLGLLTGVSYSLSTIALPTILALPSAASASRSFATLSAAAASHVQALSALSSTAFLAAFVLSPRHQRHPYLLYTSLLVLSTSYAAKLVPYLPASVLPASTTTQFAAAPAAPRKPSTKRAGSMRMEQSYEVLGDAHSDATSCEEAEEEALNGEEVRGEVDADMKTRVVQTSIAAVGFVMAVVGIWGDGVAQVIQADALVFEM